MGTIDILIVDDDQALANTLATGLKKRSLGDFNVEVCHGGNEAVSMLDKHPFDIVLTDFKMPGMTGLDLINVIRREYPDTVVILMTAFGSNELESRASRVAATYLPKPFDLPHLVNQLKSLLPASEPEINSKKQARQVLILEDDDYLRRMLAKIFTRSGILVLEAATIEQARALIEEQQFDAFICDLKIGNQKGSDLVREKRELLTEHGTSIIMITGEARYREMSEEIGVDLFLEKPVSVDALLKLVSRFVA